MVYFNGMCCISVICQHELYFSDLSALWILILCCSDMVYKSSLAESVLLLCSNTLNCNSIVVSEQQNKLQQHGSKSSPAFVSISVSDWLQENAYLKRTLQHFSFIKRYVFMFKVCCSTLTDYASF